MRMWLLLAQWLLDFLKWRDFDQRASDFAVSLEGNASPHGTSSSRISKLPRLVSSVKLSRGYVPWHETILKDKITRAFSGLHLSSAQLHKCTQYAFLSMDIFSIRLRQSRILEIVGVSIARGTPLEKWSDLKSQMLFLNNQILMHASLPLSARRERGLIGFFYATTRKLLLRTTDQLSLAHSRNSLNIFNDALTSFHETADSVTDMVNLAFGTGKDTILAQVNSMTGLTTSLLVQSFDATDPFFEEYSNLKYMHLPAWERKSRAVLARAVSINPDTNIALVKAEIQFNRSFDVACGISDVYAFIGNFEAMITGAVLGDHHSLHAKSLYNQYVESGATLHVIVEVCRQRQQQWFSIIGKCNAWTDAPNVVIARDALLFCEKLKIASVDAEKGLNNQHSELRTLPRSLVT